MNGMIVVDGHNLIPKIDGLSLSDLDDEQSLIDLLQRYARVKRGAAKRIDVFFDRAPLGQAGVQRYGGLVAHFVETGRTADEAIRLYVTSMGKAARNVTVVSSDRQVQANARALHAGVISAEDFAWQLMTLLAERSDGAPPLGEPPPPAKLDEWYDLFGVDAAQAEKPIEPPRLEKRPQRKKSPGRRLHHGPKKK